MAQSDNILQELKELESSLVNTGKGNPYHVPTGYFEGLISHVISRLKALDAANAVDEINHLSPLLSGISRKLPFQVPAGYFGELEQNLSSIATRSEEESADAELAGISPLLSGLKKEMPYSVPSGYFDEVAIPAQTKIPAKVISMPRKSVIRYAAAAVVTGIIVLSGFLIFGNTNRIDPNEKSFAWVEKSLQKVSTDDIDEFAELTEDGTLAQIDSKAELKEVNEIKQLIQDIPDNELQEFIEETQISEQEIMIAEETILN
jgi:hypothetical protein